MKINKKVKRRTGEKARAQEGQWTSQKGRSYKRGCKLVGGGRKKPGKKETVNMVGWGGARHPPQRAGGDLKVTKKWRQWDLLETWKSKGKKGNTGGCMPTLPKDGGRRGERRKITVRVIGFLEKGGHDFGGRVRNEEGAGSKKNS